MREIKIFCILALLYNTCYAKDISHLKNPNLSVNTLLRASVIKQHWGLDYFIMKTKRCTICDLKKSIAEYGYEKHGKYGVRSQCKNCRSEAYRATKNYDISVEEDLGDEMWEDVAGFKGRVRVSDKGRIKTIGGYSDLKWRGKKLVSRFFKGSILSYGTGKWGHKYVSISYNGIQKTYMVHRIVAEAFVHKPSGCNVVNHLDCNPSNNEADNLEWTTQHGNIDYARRLGRLCSGKTHYRSRGVYKKTMLGEVLEEYESVTAASKALGIGCAESIGNCCRGKTPFFADFKWDFKIQEHG